jgi:hypothetical protein
MRSCVSRKLLQLSAVLPLAFFLNASSVAAPPPPTIATAPRGARVVEQPENCPDLPLLGKEKLVSYGTNDGAALSTTAVGDRDKESTVADVFIEKGDEPLYIIVTSNNSVIWRFTGTVSRISKLYISTRQKLPPDIPAAGVVGVEKERLTFGSCLRAFTAVESIAGARSRGEIRAKLGREPDYVGGKYKTSAVSLPSMAELPSPIKQQDVPDGFDQRLWREVLMFWPAGLAPVTPSSVVSPKQAIAYDVLPSQGGLAQLVGSGALVRLEGSNEFKIVRPIARFPAGMGGSHSARFLLSKGIPMAPGDPVHSCVVSEETGEILSMGTLCGP